MCINWSLSPPQETDSGIHERYSMWEMDELSRNAQMIIQMLHFGAYQEILGVDGAKPLGEILAKEIERKGG